MVTQQVPCGLWLVLSLHCDDGGTLLCTLTTWYCVGPYILFGPKLQTGESVPGKSVIFDIAVTKVRRFRSGPAALAACAKRRMAPHHAWIGPCSSMYLYWVPGMMPGYFWCHVS